MNKTQGIPMSLGGVKTITAKSLTGKPDITITTDTLHITEIDTGSSVIAIINDFPPLYNNRVVCLSATSNPTYQSVASSWNDAEIIAPVKAFLNIE